MAQTPKSLGFRMPAEWEEQEAVWLAWPHNEATWPNIVKEVEHIKEAFIPGLNS